MSDSLIGSIKVVNYEPVGAEFVSDAITGATAIAVDPAYPFDELGGTALVTGDETVDINTEIVYSSADQDAGILYLASPLPFDVPAGVGILVRPEVIVTTAYVETDDESDPIPARVPFHMVAQLPVGPRTPSSGYETVRLEPDGDEWAIAQIYGPMPVLDGSFIDPESTIPIEALSDGIAPDASPVPTLEPFAVGGLTWSVIPEPNADPVRFKIYADWVDPPTIDADHLVDDSSSTSGVFSAIGTVRLSSVPSDPASSPSAVYVACVEYDADGDGPVSATSQPGTPRRATTEEISAEWVYAGKIEANQIKSGELDALVRLGVGDYIEMNAEESSITIYADTAHEIPLVQLRPDGSVFRGKVEADDISVLVGLILQGIESHISQSAGVTLDSSVIDPSTGPTLTNTPIISNLEPTLSGYVNRGMTWDNANSQYLRLMRQSGTIYKVQKINQSTGSIQGTTITLGSVSSVLDMSSITVLGSNWYVAVKWEEVEGGGANWRIFKYDFSGNRIAVSNLIYCDQSTPAVGNDGTDLLFVADEGGIFVLKFNTSFTQLSSWFGDSDAGLSFNYISMGSFDFGATRIVVGTPDTAAVFSLSGSTLTEQPSQEFPLVPTNSVGFTWNSADSTFRSIRTSMYKYNSYYPSASQKIYVAHADTDTGSTKHTKISPMSSITLVNRQYVQATLAPAPAGATTPRVYAALDTSTPANTAMLRRSETITSRSLRIDPATAGGIPLQRTLTPTFKARSGFTATITTSAAHNLEVNDVVTVALVSADAAFDGPATVLSTPTSTTFTYTSPTSGTISSTATGGTVSLVDTNTFGAGTPAWIKSQIGGFEVYGDGGLTVEGYPVTGAWTSYTPSWTGATTNPTAANHTITGKYQRVGRLVHFEIQIVAGSSGYGSGAYSVSLPFTAALNHRLIHTGSLRTNITIPLFGEQTTTTSLLLRVLPTTAGAGFTSMAQGTPVTLAAGDTIVISGTYDAA